MMHFYVIGSDPYSYANQHDTKGNGTWHCKAENLEQALFLIFSGILFPGEATGRYWPYNEQTDWNAEPIFFDGISIPGTRDQEVIQVWSTEKEAIKKTKAFLKGFAPHVGSGQAVGLLCELRVTEIRRYTEGHRKLLGLDGAGAPGLSPFGSSVATIAEQRRDLQFQLYNVQFNNLRKEWELDTVKESFQEQKDALDAKLRVIDTYIRGVSEALQLCDGHPAPTGTRYKVFQNRQFLNREIAVLGNFRDFDFRQLHELDAWLIESGRIWKFLPFDRTILVTRIRDERKEYGRSALEDVILNQYNFKNIIWIRDGEKVFRLGVEVDFDNAVFPDPQQQLKLVAYVQNHLWRENFSEEHYEKTNKGSMFYAKKPVPGLKKHPEKQEEPYEMDEIVRHRFKSVEEWLDSDTYRLEVHDQINRQVVDYLREKNTQQLTFVVMLQGIVDTRRILDIPPGTDLFNFDATSKYFELLYDYTHGLPDHTYKNQIEPYITHLKVGDWIVCTSLETEYDDTTRVYKIIGMKEGLPVVHYHPKSRRWSYQDETPPGDLLYERTKKPRALVLKNKAFIRRDLPKKLANAILDDRQWKMEHPELVPILDQWPRIQKKYLVAPVNFTPVEMKNRR